MPDDAPPLERPSPGSPRVNVQEAAARYAFAAADVRRSRVLDVASGTGLGSEFLLAQGELATIRGRLREHGYHRGATARNLGMTRESLWAKLRQLGFVVPRRGSDD